MWKIFSVPCGSALYKFHCIYCTDNTLHLSHLDNPDSTSFHFTSKQDKHQKDKSGKSPHNTWHLKQQRFISWLQDYHNLHFVTWFIQQCCWELRPYSTAEGQEIWWMKIWKGYWRKLSWCMSQYHPSRCLERARKISRMLVRIVSDSAKIQTGYFRNTCYKYYCRKQTRVGWGAMLKAGMSRVQIPMM
jgi:hypothetical protein